MIVHLFIFYNFMIYSLRTRTGSTYFP